MMNLPDILRIFDKLKELYIFKLIVSAIFLAFSFVFNGNEQILYTIFALIVFDTFTGFWVATKEKNVSSREFFRSARKSFFYFIMLATARLVDKQLPVHIASPIIDAFLSTTEAVSIFENLAKLGFPVPIILINKLKVFYENKQEDKK